MGGAAVTLILEKVINYAKSAVICKQVCQELERELNLIRPDVEKIEQQMERRRRQTSTEPLVVVEGWLARLKEKLMEAEKEVHCCRSGSKFSLFFVKENHDLAKRIQSLRVDIQKLAGDPVSRATLSSTISNGASHSDCGSSSDARQYGSSHQRNDGSPSVHVCSSGSESQGSLVLRQRSVDLEGILLAEAQTRQSMNLRRHSTGSFDSSNPAVQPVTHAEAPLQHFDHNQHQYDASQQQSEHDYAPPNYTQHGWFHSSSTGQSGHKSKGRP